MKKTSLIAALLLGSLNAYAGTETLVNFMNLSPYKATISFPAANQDCWHDSIDSKRINEYANYYQSNIASNKNYLPYLKGFKSTYNISDIRSITSSSMDNTSLSLTPALDGQAVQYANFRGEPSASLFNGCKNKTSSRGFDVILTDTSTGQQVSKKHYILQDPPGSEWTLSRAKDNDYSIIETKIKLGSGGRTNAIEVGATALITALTIYSIGTLGPELYAVRVALSRTASLGVLIGELTTAEGASLLSSSFSRYLIYGGTRQGTKFVINQTGSVLNGIYGRSLMIIIAGGLAQYANIDSKGNVVTSSFTPSPTQGLNQSYDNSRLLVADGLPEDRSICIFQESTFGITECRAVGINLTILPDGSLSFQPLPSIGSGD